MTGPTPFYVGPLLVGVAAILWGTVGIASKTLYGLDSISPLALGFFRLAISVPLLLVWRWRAFDKWPFGFHGRDAVILVSIGVAMAAYQICYFQAVAEIGVVLTTFVTICSAPVLIASLSIIVLGERLTGPIAIALCLGLAGTALLIDIRGNRLVAANATGIAWAAGSALAYSLFVLLSRALARHDPAKIIVLAFGMGALALLPFAASAGLALDWSASAWGLVFYIGLIPTAAAYMLYFRGMRDTRAMSAGIIALLEPLTATVLALVLFDERVSNSGVAGIGLLIVAMLILVVMRFKQPAPVREAPPAAAKTPTQSIEQR